jgi:UDP-glucose 4-epimerase
MKILVTGGAGFIGSHLCETLSKDKTNDIYSLDNYFTGSVDNHVRGVNYIKGNTKNIEELITFKPDILYHLGEYSRVEQSFDDIDKIFEYNKKGTFAVLEFVRKIGCKIIYAGSSTKFGDNGSNKDASPYAWSKSSNTNLVINYSEWFGISYAITYFYNVYGGREIKNGKYSTLIALFTNLMKNNSSLTVVSPGTQKRNFTHINDIIDALVLVGEKGLGDNFGIGSDDSFSIIEVANMYGGNIQMLPERKGNRMTAKVVTSKTKNLGWSPKNSLKEHIKNLKINNWK